MIVLDASVLIAHLDERDAHHKEATRLLVRNPEPFAASTVSLAETLVAPARTGRLEDATAALARLGVLELHLGEGAPERLARLRADTGRKLPDCCVLLAAQESRGALASFDGALIESAVALGLPIAD